MIRGITWTHIQSASNHSGPSEVRYSAIQYHTRAIIGRSQFEATLVYKPRILGLKNQEIPFLVHKLSVI